MQALLFTSSFFVTAIGAFFGWLIGIPVLLAFCRLFGLYAVVEEGTCHVYVLFGRVLGTLDEAGFYFLPLKIGDEVRGVVGVWRDAVPILERLEGMRREIVIVTLSAALIAAGLLFLVFRTAQARLTRQTEALLESTRRDPLTATLNHGALVGYLAQEIERGRDDVRPIGIALIDIDNFRLLNDNHGHEAGDEALKAVADTLRERIEPGMEFGRYGPDEFLLVATPSAVAHLEPVVQGLRTALVDLSLRFTETERLPITVSVGIATYPDHASSVTALLAVAAGILEEAKASGGDTSRHAGDATADEPSNAKARGGV